MTDLLWIGQFNKILTWYYVENCVSGNKDGLEIRQMEIFLDPLEPTVEDYLVIR